MPETLNSILNSSKLEFKNIEDAKLYLLTKLKYLISISSEMDKEFFIDQINNYLKFWIKSKRVPNRFSFKNECSIKRDGRAVWIGMLGYFSVNNPEKLKENLENNWKFYKKKFDLIKKKNRYYINVQFEPKFSSKSKSNRDSDFGKGIETSNFLDKLDLYIQFSERVAASFVTPSISQLESRGKRAYCVQGGLPSLGKKR